MSAAGRARPPSSPEPTDSNGLCTLRLQRPANGGAQATCSSGKNDYFASFSNYGSDVDIGAPGVCNTSTWKPIRQACKKRVRNGGRYRRVTKHRWVTGYATISGTSMASPHVAGAAAVYLANEKPSATPDDPTLRRLIRPHGRTPGLCELRLQGAHCFS